MNFIPIQKYISIEIYHFKCVLIERYETLTASLLR